MPKNDAVKVLVTESERPFNETIKFALEHNNFRVKSIESIEELAKISQRFQLIAVDLSSPLSDGGEVKEELGNLAINRKKMSAKLNGEKLKLTKTEFAILDYLFAHKESVISKNELQTHVYGWGELESNSLNVHIQNLRKKLGAEKEMLQTVPGFGYTLSATPKKI